MFGAIIIEPENTKVLDNDIYAEQTNILTDESKNLFREFVIFMQNGIRLLDKHGNIIMTNQGEGHG